MDSLKNFLSGLLDKITGGLRKFVAFAMVMVFIGAVFGFALPLLAERTGVAATYWLALPLLLALLAYVSSEVAFVLFLAMLGLMLVVFL